MRRSLHLSLLSVALFASSHAVRGNDTPPASVDAAWADAARGLFKEARDGFAAAEGREARLGEAVALLNVQPKTGANLDHATQLLTQVASATPADDLTVAARYYLARIDQLHCSPTDPAAARRRYEELIAIGSLHPLAQRATVELALLDLFAPGVTQPELKAHLERLLPLGKKLSDASARRDFHLVIGEAAQRHALGDSLALEHLLAADEAGLKRAITKRDVWIRIAELSRRTGRDDLARTYYRRFLDAFQRDSRRFMVEQRLAEISAVAEVSR